MEAHMRMEHNASGGGTLAGGRVASCHTGSK